MKYFETMQMIWVNCMKKQPGTIQLGHSNFCEKKITNVEVTYSSPWRHCLKPLLDCGFVHVFVLRLPSKLAKHSICLVNIMVMLVFEFAVFWGGKNFFIPHLRLSFPSNLTNNNSTYNIIFLIINFKITLSYLQYKIQGYISKLSL